ncbi:MAG: tRNA (adenosine(37)-N6)-threonylcarbamoyltransferase complex transferase subunit TsaD [Acidobacteria bacterium]|nr:tRNA (adenosine(37)-N6)-threonylcarbamoyltransferase complex transferase subunit TsaD [Acidobacteriota bacterium]MBV9475317.1 tRNA (adenosine(37)-N6)-threonylcarbamoyltransferase complex transferase subunit TsaD [Acidobacteriota bacterium]
MILGIETSCDETSVALLERDGRVRVNLIASQIERHQPFGGVVPEIASREHLQHLFPLVERALGDAGASWSDLESVAVTTAPGLIGALLVGVAGAQGLAYGLGIPLVPVNHLEGHIYSPYLQKEGPAAPLPDRFLSLVISGGHSAIYDVRRSDVRQINRTRDDAIGETFDKVAKFVGLPYPGGPQIEKHARAGAADPKRFPFPVPQFKDESLDFSYSGIKAGAIRLAREHGIRVEGDPDALASFCATFQDALFAQLFDRLEAVRSRLEGKKPAELAMAGGVAANGVLRERIAKWGEERGLLVRLPEKRYCTDNAGMIAFAGLQKGQPGDPRRVAVRSRVG